MSYIIKIMLERRLRDTLLSNFQSVLKDTTADLKSNLVTMNTGYNFGDELLNTISLTNWIIYTRSLYALKKLGCQESSLKLQNELERAKRRLEIIDFYTDGKDYHYCLAGIWAIVAIFDTCKRDELLDIIKVGTKLPISHQIKRMIEDFHFDYK